MNRLSKGILITCLMCTVIITVSATSAPFDGYEVDIYQSLFPWGWVALLIGLLVGYGGGVVIVITDRDGISSPIVGLMVLKGTVLLLPLLRRYYFYGRGDPATLFAEIGAQLEAGHLISESYYPAFDFIVGGIHLISTIEINVVMNLIPVLLTVLVPVWVYCLSSLLFHTQLKTNIVTLLSTVLLLSYRYSHIHYDPQALTLLVLPVFTYIFLRTTTRDNRYILMFIIFLVLLPFMHPLPAVIFFLMILLVGISLLDKHNRFVSNSNDALQWTPEFHIRGGAILLISAITWYSYMRFFQINVRRVIYTSLGMAETTETKRNILTLLDFDLAYIIYFSLSRMGHDLLFASVAVVGVIIVMRDHVDLRFIPILIWFFISNILQITNIVFSALPLFIIRYVGPIVALSHPLVGIAFSDGLKRNAQFFGTLLMVFLLITSGIGIISAHPSPRTNGWSVGVSESQVDSVVWIVQYAPVNGELKSIETRPSRFAQIAFGVEAKRWSIFQQEGGTLPFLPPPHFGYGSGPNQFLTMNDTYVMTTPVERTKLARNKGQSTQYSSKDFRRFTTEPNVARIYDNGETTWHSITPR